MSDRTAARETDAPKTPPVRPKTAEVPSRIYLVPYPKIVFLYPTLLVSLVAAIYMSLAKPPLLATESTPVILAVVFLAVIGVNLVILAFDFPRTTSLTLFFIFVAAGLGAALVFVSKPELLPYVTDTLHRFHPLANATFYWTFAAILGVITLIGIIHAQFDRWEARPNELLHHHGIWGNLERFSAPGLRIDKEINDVFEYLLLRSGRLILHPSNERRAIILDGVPFIRQKEEALTRMLGALQVQVRAENESHE